MTPPPSIVVLSTVFVLLLACEPSSTPDTDLKATPSVQPPVQQQPPLRTALERERETLLAPALLNLLTQHHIHHRPLDPQMAKTAIERYLDRLDPGHMLLLKPHTVQLLNHAPTLANALSKGELSVVDEAHRLMQEQIAAVRALVEQQLATPFPMHSDETYPTTREAWADTATIRLQRWRLLLHGQVLERVLALQEAEALKADALGGAQPDIHAPEPLAAYEREARRTLMEAYNAQLDSLERRSHLKELEVFFTAVASVYDPHTAYLPPQRKEELDVQLSGTTEGIGVLLEARGHQRVIAGLIPGSTGWQLGTLAVGDVVVMVAEAKRDPVALVDMPLDEATALLQGPRGSTIVLTVQKPNGRTITVQVRRDTVVLIETFARGALLTFPKKDQRHPTGYIHLPRMYGDPREGGAEPGGRRSSDDVGVLLDALKQRGIQHLILDLRNNGGGFLDDARRIAGFFIDQGPVAQLQHADGTLNILQDETPGMRYSGHVVLLV
ncbi:MAG: S41 family peptidase, partial [Myxococcota bacterium]